MESIWSASVELPHFKSMEGDIQTDVLIIGGGMAGILCAYFLQENRVPYVLVEGKTICSGITKDTTAKITAQHGLIYHRLLKSAGYEKAKMYLDANQSAVQQFVKLCHGMNCDLERKMAYVYSINDRKKLEKEADALCRLGVDTDISEKTKLPFYHVGAVGLAGQAQFHPLKFVAAIAKDQGFDYELQSLGWDAGVAAVQVGQADALIAGATIKQERIDSGWIFSDGYYDATQTFVVTKDSSIASFADLAGKNVAVKNGTAGADFANSLKDKYGFKVTVFEDSPTMYQDVILGNSAACVEDTPIMADNIKTGGLALKIPAGMESAGAPYGFAIMNKANQPLLDMFNAGLKNIKENGTYQAILDKYLK